jgi:hypothetical protein
VSGGWVVGILVVEDSLAAESIDESGPTCMEARQLASIERGQVMKKDAPVPDAPQTIRQNWIPFLTFFFRRILV